MAKVMANEFRIEGLIVRGLTLWRPWPWCFTDADKRLENRPWKLPKHLENSWLALHSGKKFDTEALLSMAAGHFGTAAMGVSLLPWKHPDGVITALARVTHSVTYNELSTEAKVALGPFAFGPECWLTPEVVKLPIPIPSKGAQGLWRLSGAVATLVEQGFERARAENPPYKPTYVSQGEAFDVHFEPADPRFKR